MLSYQAIDEFYEWLMINFPASVRTEELTEIFIDVCKNQSLGLFLQKFGYEFLFELLNAYDYEQSLIDHTNYFIDSSPIDHVDRDLLLDLLFLHLGGCRYCRHINSVYVADDLSKKYLG